MSVVGSLEDLSFPDLLQVIHVSRQSGTLILSGSQGTRRVTFRNGLVCGATLGEGGPELEEILVERGMVDSASVDAARDHQTRTGEPLPSSLVTIRAITQETLEQVVRQELHTILRSLVLLEEGEFRFELDCENRSRNPGDAIDLSTGIEPESILTSLEGKATKGRGAAGAATNTATMPAGPMPSHVLLVSDRAVLRLALRDQLRKIGFRVSACSTPEAALDLARSFDARGEEFCLVCTLILPEKKGTGWRGGLSLVRSLRRTIPELRAILFSEVRDERAREEALAAGAVSYLSVPELSSVALDDIGDRLSFVSSEIAAAIRNPSSLTARGDLTPTGSVRAMDQLSLLRALIGEMSSNRDAEIPLLVLRLAAEYFERGVLFAVRGDQACSTGAFDGSGVEDDGDRLEERVRGAVLPLRRGSILGRAVQDREPYIGPLTRTGSNRPLLDSLGQPVPLQAALLPLLSGQNVFGVLYGDNAPSGRPLGNLKALEIFLTQAGFALENAWLQRRIALMSGRRGMGQHV